MIANTELNAMGWLLMLLSTLSVTGVTIWCFYRVLTHAGGPSDEPPDDELLPPG